VSRPGALDGGGDLRPWHAARFSVSRRDREALDNFLASDLWKSVGSHPALADFDVRPFVVVEDFTKATQPGLVIV
jgi:hypothetical protein